MTNSTSQNTPIHFILSILAALIITGLSLQDKTSWITTPINTLTTPIRSPLLTLRQHLEYQAVFFKNLPHQQRIIDDLKRQNTQLNVQAQKVQELEKENLSLKSFLSANVSPNHQVISAKVIALSRFAIINQGSNSGVTPGSPVVIDDILLGVVSKTYSNSSQVQLIEDIETSIPASSLSNASGIITFSNNTLQLIEIPQKAEISADDSVFTSGSNSIPNGLLIGKVKDITEKESSIYKTATIEPSTSISQHEYVFIILD